MDKNRRKSGGWFSFRLRTLLAVVTIVSLLMALSAFTLKRAQSLRDRSQKHLMMAGMFQQVAEGVEQLPNRNPEQERQLARMRAKFNFHVEQSLKCDAAVWRPWITVVDEAPPP